MDKEPFGSVNGESGNNLPGEALHGGKYRVHGFLVKFGDAVKGVHHQVRHTGRREPVDPINHAAFSADQGPILISGAVQNLHGMAGGDLNLAGVTAGPFRQPA